MRRYLRTAWAVVACCGAFVGLASFAAAPRQALDQTPGNVVATETVEGAETPPLPPSLSDSATTVGPPTPGCAPDGHSAVVDRVNQRAWLCEAGRLTEMFVMTSAVSQPDPGVYAVYAKDLEASSNLDGRSSTMTHFVAFSYGEYRGARIAFHSIPRYSDGEFVQPLESVGTPELFGDSAGCIRLLPDNAIKMWDWLNVGDPVTVVS